MALTLQDVNRIAHLARLDLQPAEQAAMLAQINGFFSIVEQMSAVDTTGIEPLASLTGRPAPIAAAIGSSIRYTSDAPAPSADSRIARRSTWVEPQGTQMMILGLGLRMDRGWTILMNCFSICSVTVKSAMTPSFIGRMASMLPGTLPSIALASAPTA